MTKAKTILGISFAAAFVFSMVLIPAYAGGHLTIEKAKVDATPTEIKKAKIDTTGKIPTKGGFVGYGIVTTGADIIVATTHAGVLDSELQKGDPMSPKWHNHYVTLGPSTGCTSGTEVLNISYESPGKVKVKGDKIEIKGVPLGTAIPAHFGLAPNVATTFTTGTYDGFVAVFTISPSPVPNPVYGLTVCIDGLTTFAAP